jgi:2-C-methyl-D-erythritol 4-phosphate cytidylyltransferase
VGTDDASLVEKLGGNIKIIYGSKRNIKITNREDLIFATAMVKAYPPNLDGC